MADYGNVLAHNSFLAPLFRTGQVLGCSYVSSKRFRGSGLFFIQKMSRERKEKERKFPRNIFLCFRAFLNKVMERTWFAIKYHKFDSFLHAFFNWPSFTRVVNLERYLARGRMPPIYHRFARTNKLTLVLRKMKDEEVENLTSTTLITSSSSRQLQER